MSARRSTGGPTSPHAIMWTLSATKFKTFATRVSGRSSLCLQRSPSRTFASRPWVSCPNGNGVHASLWTTPTLMSIKNRSGWPLLKPCSGRALPRLLSHLVHANPRFGPAKLAKIDVADGFYRVGLRPADIPKLGVILPHSPSGTPLIAFPLALPMGWVESPPFFTALTETVCDLANAATQAGRANAATQAGGPSPKVHPLEPVANTPAPDAPSTCSTLLDRWPAYAASLDASSLRTKPLSIVDVYVDDFLLAAQTKREQCRLLRRALHAIDAVFCPLTPDDAPSRKAPASVKKMKQGDASWAYRKRMLGWIVDTVAETLELPPHRLDRLYAILDELRPPWKRMAISQWHKLLGELRSMSLAIPGSTGLFSVLQDTLKRGDKYRVRLNRHVYNCASDFRALADSLGTRPTHFRELVPLSPSDIDACDACRLGMGGVWFDALTPSSPPLVWRTPFPTLSAPPLSPLSIVGVPCPFRIWNWLPPWPTRPSSPPFAMRTSGHSGSMGITGPPSPGRPKGPPAPPLPALTSSALTHSSNGRIATTRAIIISRVHSTAWPTTPAVAPL